MMMLLKRLAVLIAILYAYISLERTVNPGVRANLRHRKRVIHKVVFGLCSRDENGTLLCQQTREYAVNDFEAKREFIKLIDSDAISTNPEEDLAAEPICLCENNIDIRGEDRLFPIPNDPTVAPVEREEEADEHFRSFVGLVIRLFAGLDILEVCA